MKPLTSVRNQCPGEIINVRRARKRTMVLGRIGSYGDTRVRVTIAAVALCALALACGSTLAVGEPGSAAKAAEPVQAPSDQGAAWYGAYQRDSHLVPLPDGRSLNLYCLGEGSPSVVLESGLTESAFTWWKVQGRIAKLARVCAYDRAGMGKSPPGPLPRDTAAEVADLEALLTAGGVRPPYILVGHSMGGYNARLFASLHMPDIAGMVLVDVDRVPDPDI